MSGDLRDRGYVSERELALRILMKIEKGDAFSNLEIKRALSENRVYSPDFLRTLVYGVLERKLYLDYKLDKLMDRGLKGTKPELLMILRMGAYQLEFMDGVPDYGVIDSSVELSKRKYRGLQGLVNGVLRNYAASGDGITPVESELGEKEFLKIQYSCGEELIDLLLGQYGREKCENFLSRALEKKPMELRVNRAIADRDEIVEGMRASGCEAEATELVETGIYYSGESVTDTSWYMEGQISIQSIGSQIIAAMTGAGPGDVVLDICAAPGGKSLAMAEAMENKGRIIAMDISSDRLKNLPDEAKRIKSDIIEVLDVDGRSFMEEYAEMADIVLLDVPCSGLGVISSKPEIKYRRFSDYLEELEGIQEAILKNGADYVRPGGKLIYSTCTVNRRENEGRIETFLSKDDRYRLVKQVQILDEYDDVDGFFVAALERE